MQFNAQCIMVGNPLKMNTGLSAGYKGFSLRNFSFQFSQGLIIEFETEPILELLNVLKKGTYDPKTIRLNTLAVKVPVIKTILDSGWCYNKPVGMIMLVCPLQ